jgi:hypothetical protein
MNKNHLGHILDDHFGVGSDGCSFDVFQKGFLQHDKELDDDFSTSSVLSAYPIEPRTCNNQHLHNLEIDML